MNETARVYARTLSDPVRELAAREFGDQSQVELSDQESATQPTGEERESVAVRDAGEYFSLARRLADDTCARLAAEHPGLFTTLLPGRDLSPAFRAGLALRLGLKELPPLMAFLAQSAEPQTTRILVNTSLHPDQVSSVERFIGQEPGAPVACRSTVPMRLLDQHHKRLRRQRPPPGDAALPGVSPRTPIGLCGSDTDAGPLRAVAQAVGAPGLVILAKNDRPETQRTVAALRQSAAATVSAERFALLEPLTDSRVAAARAVGEMAERERVLNALQQEFRLHHLKELMALVDAALSLQALLAEVQPRLIVGALDRSPFGPLLGLFQGDHRSSVVNVQHGTFMPARVLDLMHFDLALVWNDATAALLRRDGLTAGKISVVGNPVWDETRGSLGPALGPVGADVQAWKGNGQLLVVFPQPPKGPFLTSTVIARFYQTLHTALSGRDNIRVLVKHRARRGQVDPDPATQRLLADTRVREVGAAELPLGEALSLADLAVGIYSTALADALVAGVPAVSLDTTGVVRTIGLDFVDQVVHSRDAQGLATVLDALEGGALPTADDIRTRSEAFAPRLSASYGARLSKELSRVGRRWRLPTSRRRR